MNAVFPPATAPTTASHSVRVMIVEDAVVVREILRRWIDSEPDMQTVALLRDGRDAVDQIEQHDPDVVVLDIDMPRLDGLAALPLLLAKRPDLVVLMASTLTRRNAEISLKALMLGAKDYVAKPDSEGNVVTSTNFRRDVIEKIRILGQAVHRRKGPRLAARLRQQLEKPLTTAGRIASPPLAPAQPADVMLRAFPQTVPRVLTIGASTGGPQALISIVARLSGVFDRAPVLITQHMPPIFTAILAEHLSRASGRPAHEAVDGEEINAETIYLAPGGWHMRVVRRDGVAVIALDDGPAVKFCKPAVDLLFSSAAQIWGPHLVSLVLTGMGSDGLRGAQDVVAAGGSVIAQDKATSVIWGMPGQVVNAGLCSAVLPLMDIAPRLTRLFAGGWQ